MNFKQPQNLEGMVFISITGEEADTFLQGQLSCDVLELLSSDGQLGCYCNIKGRITAVFHIFKTENGFLLRMPY